MTSSSAIARVDAGSVNMSRASSGRQRATSTSRSRAVSAGGACSTSVAAPAGASGVAEDEPGLADPDLVAVSQPPRGPDTLAVDPRAVGRTEVGHAPASREPLEHGVQAARRGVVVDGDVVLGRLADGRAVRRRGRRASCARRTSPRSAVTRARSLCARDPARGEPVLTLFRERYEVLATVGSGGEAQIVKALDRQHDRFVALKIRPVRDQADARGPARRGARAAGAAAASGAAARARGLLRRRRLRRGDGLGRGHRPGDAAGRERAARGSRRRSCSPSSRRRPRRSRTCTRSRRRSSTATSSPATSILTKGGRIKLVDFGLSSAPNVPRVRARHARLPRSRAGRRRRSVASERRLLARGDGVRAAHRLSRPPASCPRGTASTPTQAQQLEAAIRLGMATDPARRPKTPGELVERLRAGWAAALPTGVVTFCCSDIEGSTALWEANPEAMAEALVRHDELIADAVARRGGSVIKSMGEGDSTVSVFDSAAGRGRGRARRQPGADRRGVAAGHPHRRTLGPPHRRGRAPRRRLLRPERSTSPRSCARRPTPVRSCSPR